MAENNKKNVDQCRINKNMGEEKIDKFIECPVRFLKYHHIF